MALLSSVASIAVYYLFASLICGQGISITEGVDISRNCFGCICESASGCNITIGCDGSVCGPFRITWAYWVDADKPMINDANHGLDSYSRCANDLHCSTRTVQNYMNRFAQDCNSDGAIDCHDFLRIHRLGGYGCTGHIPSDYLDSFNRCLDTVRHSQTH